MDPPPLIANVNPTTATTTTAAAPTMATTIQLSYPDSMESSPRTRPAETYGDPLPPVPGAKLRLMCSYGGHIMPRPHDKALTYIGGETRLVVVDRNSSLSSLCSRLSRTLLNGRPFTLKYQLPNEDLNSLVSITTDEDLDNMVEEYDRITATSASSLSSSRIRVFLFANKLETAATMGSLLDDAKSETWFVDALNGSGLLPRGLSDTAATNCLVNLDDSDLEAQVEGAEEEKKQMFRNVAHEVQYSTPDSPMLENSSSYGSSSSSPSMSNLPPIRVRVEEQKMGIEEQFALVTFGANAQKQDDGVGLMHAVPPPMPIAIADAVPVAMINQTGAGGRENVNRVLSDDERSDQGVPVGFRRPPLPLQPVQPKAACASYNLPSPDSVASDSSVASANSFSKPTYYQDHVHVASRENRASNSPNTNSQIQVQQIQDSGYMLPPQYDQQQATVQQQQQQQPQQQFVHASMHYIPHPASAPVPMTSYYPVYAPPSQQQLHQPTNQHYPVYVMPVTQPQTYMSMQSNNDAAVVPSSQPTTTPNPTIIAASATHKDGTPPIYPTKTIATAKPEMAASVYRTTLASAPQMVQVPSNQFQPQYMGFSQMHHQSQSIAAAPPAATANYGYEYTNATHDPVYFTQHQAPPLPSQYQTMSPAAAVGALADAAKQMPVEAAKQQIITSQPL